MNDEPASSAVSPSDHFGWPIWVPSLLVGTAAVLAVVAARFQLFDGDEILFLVAMAVIAATADIGRVSVGQEGIFVRQVFRPRGRLFHWHEIESFSVVSANRAIVIVPKRGNARRVNMAIIGLSPKRDIAAAIASWKLAYEHLYCSLCGYSLRGNTSGACPECGTAVPQPPPAPASA